MNAEQQAAVDILIAQKAQTYSLDPSLIRAIIQQESNWNINARLWEPRLNEASVGLMQVLVSTATQVLGYTVTEQQLYDPNLNLEAGCKFLLQLMGRFAQQGIDAVIAAYNAGSPRFTSAGVFVNQSYVDKVDQYYGMYVNLGGAAQTVASTYSKLTGGPESGSPDSPTGLFVLSAAILFFDVFKFWHKTRKKA